MPRTAEVRKRSRRNSRRRRRRKSGMRNTRRSRRRRRGRRRMRIKRRRRRNIMRRRMMQRRGQRLWPLEAVFEPWDSRKFLYWDMCSGSAFRLPPQEAPKRLESLVFHGSSYGLPLSCGSNPMCFTHVSIDCPSPGARILYVLRMLLVNQATGFSQRF